MSETWGSGVGGSGSIEDGSEESSGGGTLSRLIIKVPGYDGGTATSYLRLGAVPTTEEPGKPLADLVDPAEAFIDDNRDRGGDQDLGGTHGLSKQARKAESAALHTKGGWRDHSDGNRITTTAGDKVEVIRGNYRLIVLGRQDETSNAHTYDASGGLLQSGDIAPGSISEIKWVQDRYSGTWHVLEEAEKGHQKTVYHGDVEEIFYGNNMITTVGSETPTTPIGLKAGNSPQSVKANPTIVEQTWATKITTSTGSSARSVPSINESTYADTTTSKTQVGIATEETRAGIQVSTLVAGLVIEASAVGLKLELYAGPVIESYNGIKLEVCLAAKITISGPLTIDLTWGKSVGLHNFKDEMDLMETKLVGVMDNKISTAKTEITASTDTKLSGVDTKINQTKTELTSTITTRISNVATALGNLKTDLMSAHILL